MRKMRSALPRLPRSTRRRGLVAAAAFGLVLPLTVSHVALAEGAVDVSATGDANGDVVAVSGTGSAYSSGGVAASGVGNAYGGIAGMSVAGDAGGGTASVDPDRTVGDANKTAWATAGQTGHVVHTGLNLVESAYQSTVIATAQPADPASIAQRMQDLANYAPHVAQNVAEGFFGAPSPSSSSASEASMNHPADGPVPWLHHLDMNMYSHYGQPPDGCLPASAYNAYMFRGMPNKEQLYREMGTGESGGTTLRTAHGVIKNHYRGPYQPILDRAVDAVDLLNKVTTASHRHAQGGILAGNVAHLWWWQQDGIPREGLHAITFYGYWHYYQGGGLFATDSGMPHHYDAWRAINRQLIITEALAFAEGIPPHEPNLIW